ncbi:MAG: hypothetical protein WBV82_27920 [Myxococcaceae bacterium]
MSSAVELNLERFAPLQGTTFVLQGPSGPVPLELVGVSALRGGLPGQRAPFSLLFLGPDATHLPQQIWPLEHDVLGRLELFLVPVGPAEGRMRYEAIFS